MSNQSERSVIQLPENSKCFVFGQAVFRASPLRACLRIPPAMQASFFLATRPVKFAARRRRQIVLKLALTPIFSHSSFNFVTGLKRSWRDLRAKKRSSRSVEIFGRPFCLLLRLPWTPVSLNLFIALNTDACDILVLALRSFRLGVTFLYKSSCHSSLYFGVRDCDERKKKKSSSSTRAPPHR